MRTLLVDMKTTMRDGMSGYVKNGPLLLLTQLLIAAPFAIGVGFLEVSGLISQDASWALSDAASWQARYETLVRAAVVLQQTVLLLALSTIAVARKTGESSLRSLAAIFSARRLLKTLPAAVALIVATVGAERLTSTFPAAGAAGYAGETVGLLLTTLTLIVVVFYVAGVAAEPPQAPAVSETLMVARFDGARYLAAGTVLAVVAALLVPLVSAAAEYLLVGAFGLTLLSAAQGVDLFLPLLASFWVYPLAAAVRTSWA